MIIEIGKAGFRNKGAELMLLAVVERLRALYPDAALTMIPSAPGGEQPFEKITALGIFPKFSLRRLGANWGNLAALIPGRLRRRYGLILDREVDVVLDVAGFAYSDQWGAAPSVELARSARRRRANGTKVILMPQAFGPFADGEIQQAIRSAVDNADLVLARDKVSYKHLTEVTGECDTIRQFPDFTNLINGAVPDDFDAERFGVALVPNVRMIDKTGDTSNSRYVGFMTACASRLIELDARPFMLVHEGQDDERLAQQIAAASGRIPVVKEDDPLRIKGILGKSRAVVGSRFHALVSALSQGVPAVATGWSHKYTELFEDYGFPEGVLSMDDARQAEVMIDRIVEADSGRAISARLLEHSVRLKARSEEMWSAVVAVIDGRRQ